jgi:CelD/BcsL family acetyltransferase involved in cellulose biosynthesis
MSLCERDVMVRREQCQDLLRQAERERLARLALSMARAMRYRKALHWLGGRLQSWGHGLVELGTTPTDGERLMYGPG